ncbi:MAG: Na/Pi cotransporter family protein [Clostridia bacterium]|nr:Na/Pi cotransporter family protein [Clostridia bacterium]
MNTLVLHLIMLFGGLAFFLYGMNVMSSGLEKMAGGKLQRALNSMTSNPFKSLVLGAGITIAIQSSSALTVMLVGLVNSGIMQIGQTVGVIMGSNVGTTLTTWILSLAGIESNVLWLQLLKPKNFSLVFALVGILLIMISKNNKKKDIGSILVGFAILMYSMELMGTAVDPLKESEQFASILTAFTNPLLGIAVGAVFTGVIQSSAASVSILQTLSLTGNITFGMAIPIIMGQNIGTCVTALISSIGVSRNARKVSVIHIAFNLIGTAVFLVLYYIFTLAFPLELLTQATTPFGIAISHSIFNIATTVMLLPFSKMLVNIANKVIPDKGDDKIAHPFIDERLLATPSFAIQECRKMTVNMAEVANRTISASIRLLNNYNKEVADEIVSYEDTLDNYEDHLGTALVKISSHELSDVDGHEVSKLLHTIGDFERLGDHALNLMKVAEEIEEKKIVFSPDATKELETLGNAITEIMDITIAAFSENDVEMAKRVEPLEEVIDILIAESKTNHIERLRKGNCTIEMGFILSDWLTNYERISDHCSNIAVAVIELAHDSFDTHEYLNNLKQNNPEFISLFEEFRAKYSV